MNRTVGTRRLCALHRIALCRWKPFQTVVDFHTFSTRQKLHEEANMKGNLLRSNIVSTAHGARYGSIDLVENPPAGTTQHNRCQSPPAHVAKARPAHAFPEVILDTEDAAIQGIIRRQPGHARFPLVPRFVCEEVSAAGEGSGAMC